MLDRDGTLVFDPHYYIYKTEDFKLLPGVIEGLKKLSEEYIFVIMTNQSGIGRGVYTENDMNKFNEKLINELKKEGIEIKKMYHCPHTPEQACDCRKPSAKYVKQAEKEFNIDAKSSWVIGDKPQEIYMGRKAKYRNIYLLTGHGKEYLDDLEKNNIKPDFIAENFLQAAEFIMNNK